MTNDVYLSCVAAVRRDMITATAAISAISSFLMGLLANLPVGLAPGLSLNSYVRALILFRPSLEAALTMLFSLPILSSDSMARG
jgi:xanthine/uracil/vitamin C permease (AzgA family)